jgi:hypothetical protein
MEGNMKYKVGDEVLIRGVVVEVDPDDEQPYLVRFPNAGGRNWTPAENIIALISRDEPKTPKPEPKIKVGDRVTHRFKPEWGIGTVINASTGTDTRDYVSREELKVSNEDAPCVEFRCSRLWWTFKSNLIPVDK